MERVRSWGTWREQSLCHLHWRGAVNVHRVMPSRSSNVPFRDARVGESPVIRALRTITLGLNLIEHKSMEDNVPLGWWTLMRKRIVHVSSSCLLASEFSCELQCLSGALPKLCSLKNWGSMKLWVSAEWQGTTLRGTESSEPSNLPGSLLLPPPFFLFFFTLWFLAESCHHPNSCTQHRDVCSSFTSLQREHTPQKHEL